MAAIGCLIVGGPGSGKSHSIKGMGEDKVKIISLFKPILPFRGDYEVVKVPPDSQAIIRELKNTNKKAVVIDDFQFLLGIPMMKRIGEKGWDKFNDIQQPYSDVLFALQDLPDDMIVYFTSHTETTSDGQTKVKTIGNALDKYITIEGLFMIVLGTAVIDAEPQRRYCFTTQTNGRDTVKSPEGMFPSYYIDNDLGYVDEKIRNYYHIGEYKSDEEMAAEDEKVKTDLPEKKPRRGRSREKEEKPVKAPSEEEKTEDAGDERPRSSADATDSTGDDGSDRGEAETDGSGSAERSAEEDVGTRVSTRSRKRLRDDPERKAVIERNAEKIAYAGLEDVPEGVTDVPFDENVKMPELEPLPKRKSRKAKEDFMPEPETPAEDKITNEEKPVSRRRRRN
jgi:hypothetical protein